MSASKTLNAVRGNFRRSFFLVFQYLKGNVLPTCRQKMPIATQCRQRSATVMGFARHHVRHSSGTAIAAGYTATDASKQHCETHVDDPDSPIAN
jgi:hypothetical protein